jgi:hypothetical protein
MKRKDLKLAKDDPIFALVDGVLAIQKQAALLYEPMVDVIIRTGCRDVQRIEQTLGGLLDFACYDPVLAMFKRLCRYYWDIDPHATAAYVNAYRDLWGDE